MRYAANIEVSQLSDPDAPWAKHSHGSGRIGRFATVGPDVYVRNDSTVGGHCELYGDEIFVQQDSHLTGWCRVSGHSVVSQSSLSGFVQSTNSEIHCSRLDGDIWAVDSEISRSQLTVVSGQQSRMVSSQLNGVTAYGPVFVQNAKVENCELLPLVRILGGDWSRSPRIKRSPFQFHVIESHEPESLLIGCWTRTIEEWKALVAIYRRLGNKMASVSEVLGWDDGEMLGGFEKLPAEELEWYASAIESW